MKSSKKHKLLILQLGAGREKSLNFKVPKESGYQSLKALEFRALKYKTPVGRFDYVLLSSQTTLSFISKIPKAKKMICIGPKTAAALKARNKRLKLRVLKDSSSRGVFEFFEGLKKSKASNGGRGTSIYFPRSKRGNPEIVLKLRKLGFKVQVENVYDTKILNLRKPLLHFLNLAKLAELKVLFILNSPSSLQALCKSLTKKELREAGAQLCAIGPTTAKAIRDAGFRISAIPGRSAY